MDHHGSSSFSLFKWPLDSHRPGLPSQTQGPPGHGDQRHGTQRGKSMSAELGVAKHQRWGSKSFTKAIIFDGFPYMKTMV